MQRRVPFVGIISIVALLCQSTYANAASSIAGQSCKKSGAVQTTQGKRFICTKSGTKLVWKFASVVVTALPPQKTPVSSQSSKPTSEAKPEPPVIPLFTADFTSLFNKRRSLSTDAWNNILSTVNTNESKLPNVEIFTGPNTKPLSTSVKEDLALVSRALPRSVQPTKIRIIYYSYKDLDWGTNKAKELMGVKGWEAAFSAHGGPLVKCNNPANCTDGDAYATDDGVAYLAVGLPENPDSNIADSLKRSPIEMTEYYHVLQEIYYQKNNLIAKNVGGLQPANKPPFWMALGGEAIARLIYNAKSADASNYRNEIAGTLHYGAPGITNFNETTIRGYLNLENVSSAWRDITWNHPTTLQANVLGLEVMNILVAIKGPSVILDFYEYMSQGKDFASTFYLLFGSTWTQAEPFISKIIWDQFQGNY